MSPGAASATSRSTRERGGPLVAEPRVKREQLRKLGHASVILIEARIADGVELVQVGVEPANKLSRVGCRRPESGEREQVAVGVQCASRLFDLERPEAEVERAFHIRVLATHESVEPVGVRRVE